MLDLSTRIADTLNVDEDHTFGVNVHPDDFSKLHVHIIVYTCIIIIVLHSLV